MNKEGREEIVEGRRDPTIVFESEGKLSREGRGSKDEKRGRGKKKTKMKIEREREKEKMAKG